MSHDTERETLADRLEKAFIDVQFDHKLTPRDWLLDLLLEAATALRESAPPTGPSEREPSLEQEVARLRINHRRERAAPEGSPVPRPCRPSRDPEAVRQIIETESAGKIDPADHPMSHWWHCSTCRSWHPSVDPA